MKKRLTYCFLTLVFFCYQLTSSAQVNKLDSLFSALKISVDTQKVNVLNALAQEYEDSDVDIAFKYSHDALLLAEKIEFRKGISKSSNIIGSIYENQGKLDEAKEIFLHGLNALDSKEDRKEIAKASVNVGIIYAELGDFEKGREYMLKALTIHKEIKDNDGYGNVLVNLGGIYDVQKKWPQALDYYQQSLKLATESNNEKAMAKCLTNISYVYFEQMDYANAKIYLEKSNELSVPLKEIRLLKENYQMLTEIYTSEKQFGKALEYQLLFAKMKDSVSKENSMKQLQQLEVIYEAGKKQKQIELLNKEKETQTLLAQEESKRKNFIIIAVVVGLLLVILFCVLLFNRFRIIKHQKIIIEEKNKDITDSIKYAKRIQTSLLPTEKYIDKSINRLNKK